MHNLISYNQLANWKIIEKDIDYCNEQNDLINDYYNCLIECNDKTQICKRTCRELFNKA